MLYGFVVLYFTQFFLRELSLLNLLTQTTSISSLQQLLSESHLQHLLIPQIAILFLSYHQSLILSVFSLFSLIDVLIFCVFLIGVFMIVRNRLRGWKLVLLFFFTMLLYFLFFSGIAIWVYVRQDITYILLSLQMFSKFFFVLFLGLSLVCVIMFALYGLSLGRNELD